VLIEDVVEVESNADRVKDLFTEDFIKGDGTIGVGNSCEIVDNGREV
jgi:hypothetical protein